MNDNIKQQLCREDFYLMLENACAQAGGGNLKKLRDMKLRDVVDILAHNGVRMVYMPEKHMNSIQINWETTGKPSAAVANGDVKSPPKRKQLLCDSKDTGEDEE
jgi:hypothetical protein